MTRKSIRRDLQALWLGRRSTVVFVTHSIEEAVRFSSLACVVTPRPGRVERLIEIDLPWPRGLDVRASPAFTRHVRGIEVIFHDYGVL